MGREKRREQDFFEELCRDYYEKVLRYLCYTLRDETAARDCVQDVFLTALQKSALLMQHPNPGGFVFQTAKNLAHKTRREGFQRMLREAPVEDEATQLADSHAGVEEALDREIDESQYLDMVLEQLSDEKFQLYSLYYVRGKSMGEIAADLGLEEAALRMRYVRLRREIRSIAAQVADNYFIS